MKYVLFLSGALLGTLLTASYYTEETQYYPLECSKEAAFVVEMVANDTLLEQYLLSPTVRVRTKQAIKEFNKKYPQ